jgi:hypothetical protein
MAPKRNAGARPAIPTVPESSRGRDLPEGIDTPDDDSTQEDPAITGETSRQVDTDSQAKTRGPAVKWDDLDPETRRDFTRRMNRDRKAEAKRKRQLAKASSDDLENEESSSDESTAEPTASRRREPTFRGHKAVYAAKNQQEYLKWLTALEMDHKVHPKQFRDESLKVYYALKTLTEGSEAERRARIDGSPITLDNCSWEQFKELMQDALGSEALRHQITYNKWFHAKWQKDNPTGTLATLKSLENLLPEPVTTQMALYHYWQLAPPSLTSRVPFDIGRATREDLARALDRLVSDDRRAKLMNPDRNNGDTRPPRASSPKGTTQRRKKMRKNTRGQSASPPRQNAKRDGGDKPAISNQERDALKAKGLCFYGCGEKWAFGHDCRKKSQKNPNALAMAATRVTQAFHKQSGGSGKEPAS